MSGAREQGLRAFAGLCGFPTGHANALLCALRAGGGHNCCSVGSMVRSLHVDLLRSYKSRRARRAGGWKTSATGASAGSCGGATASRPGTSRWPASRPPRLAAPASAWTAGWSRPTRPARRPPRPRASPGARSRSRRRAPGRRPTLLHPEPLMACRAAFVQTASAAGAPPVARRRLRAGRPCCGLTWLSRGLSRARGRRPGVCHSCMLMRSAAAAGPPCFDPGLALA